MLLIAHTLWELKSIFYYLLDLLGVKSSTSLFIAMEVPHNP